MKDFGIGHSERLPQPPLKKNLKRLCVTKQLAWIPHPITHHPFTALAFSIAPSF